MQYAIFSRVLYILLHAGVPDTPFTSNLYFVANLLSLGDCRRSKANIKSTLPCSTSIDELKYHLRLTLVSTVNGRAQHSKDITAIKMTKTLFNRVLKIIAWKSCNDV